MITSKGARVVMTVNREKQEDMIARVESLFVHYAKTNPDLLLTELASLGFLQKGGNVAAKTFEHTQMELFLIIGLGEDGGIVHHEVIAFEAMKIQR